MVSTVDTRTFDRTKRDPVILCAFPREANCLPYNFNRCIFTGRRRGAMGAPRSGRSDLSEWQRSADAEEHIRRRQMVGTATGLPSRFDEVTAILKTILRSKFERSEENKKTVRAFANANNRAVYRSLTKLQPNLQSRLRSRSQLTNQRLLPLHNLIGSTHYEIGGVNLVGSVGISKR